jgi:signal recognition particle subunit SRP54
MREVRLALLEADVSYKVVKDFVKTVGDRAVDRTCLKVSLPRRWLSRSSTMELTKLMVSENVKLNISSQSPDIVVLVGLQGAGK